MMRKRIQVNPTPCLDVVRPAGCWDLVVRVYDKFEVRILPSLRLMCVILLERVVYSIAVLGLLQC